jgi:hypothetical protein
MLRYVPVCLSFSGSAYDDVVNVLLQCCQPCYAVPVISQPAFQCPETASITNIRRMLCEGG